MRPEISLMFCVIIMVLLVEAFLPSSPRYCSATHSLTAALKLAEPIASAIGLIPDAVVDKV
jgi:hypothetical protein